MVRLREEMLVPDPHVSKGGNYELEWFILSESKREVYDRYGKEGLMGAGEYWGFVELK